MAKLKEINDILEDVFGIPERSQDEEPLGTLIHTILSQNTNDTNSERAFNNLIEKYPTWEDVLSADVKELAETIRIGGLAGQKSVRIKQVLKWLKDNYGKLNLDFICDMDTTDAIQLLTSLKGIGLKTANVLLCFACGKETFPVDTHILRISKRLALVPEKASSEMAHEIMGQIYPKGKAYSLHVNMINFGRTICHARKPKCRECPLINYCIAWQEFMQ
ncbi:TPA: endonuclease III [Candidatus Poribacteria bacterium]|nr:endonuclease III [Candidatus Poribacteria bacterium]